VNTELADLVKKAQIEAFTSFFNDLNSNGISVSAVIDQHAEPQAIHNLDNEYTSILYTMFGISKNGRAGMLVYTSPSYPEIRLGQDFYIEREFEGFDALDNPVTILSGYEWLDKNDTNTPLYDSFQDTLIDICDRYTDLTGELFSDINTALF
jgi:hypothetical protein